MTAKRKGKRAGSARSSPPKPARFPRPRPRPKEPTKRKPVVGPSPRQRVTTSKGGRPPKPAKAPKRQPKTTTRRPPPVKKRPARVAVPRRKPAPKPAPRKRKAPPKASKPVKRGDSGRSRKPKRPVKPPTPPRPPRGKHPGRGKKSTRPPLPPKKPPRKRKRRGKRDRAAILVEQAFREIGVPTSEQDEDPKKDVPRTLTPMGALGFDDHDGGDEYYEFIAELEDLSDREVFEMFMSPKKHGIAA